MKICIASWAPFHAGAEVAAERLAMGLKQAGHEVLVLLGTDGETRERMLAVGLDCRHIAMHLTDRRRPWLHAAAQWRIRRVLREFAPEILHFNDLPTCQMASRAARGLPIARVCHHRYIFEGPAIDWMLKYGADRHLFVSRAVMEDLRGNSAKLAAKPSSVVYDGLPLPVAPTADDRLAARTELGLARDKRLVLFAGQLIERKGLADLLGAWMLLPESLRHTSELLVVGDDLQGQGAYRVEMEKLATELACPAKFFGFQRNVPQWLAAADMAVVPSHVEPLGNATLEAMAAALPVIGADVGGIPEMIVEGETGLLCPARSPAALAGALGRLLEDAEIRQRMGLAGRRRCEDLFSIDAHTKNVLLEYGLALTSKNAIPNSV